MGCIQCARVSIIVCNFVLLVLGLIILAVSVYADLEPIAQDYVHASGQYEALKISLYVFIVIGTLTVITAIVGCCGAYHESPCLLASYTTVIIILFITELAIGVLGFVFRKEILSNTHNSLLEGVSAHLSHDNSNQQRDIARYYLNTIQYYLHCCGASGPDDFNGQVPQSCCRFPTEVCQPSSSPSTGVYYTVGCTGEYTRFIKENMLYFFVALLVLIFVQLISMGMSIALCCSHKPSSRNAYTGVPMVDL